MSQPRNPTPVGDENVQRLLARAYRPESPDEEFVERMKREMQTARRQSSAVERAAAVEGPNPLQLPPWQIFAGWGLAVSILALFFYFAGARPGKRDGDEPNAVQGDVLWRNGTPYLRADASRPPSSQSAAPLRVNSSRKLAAAPRASAAKTPQLTVGQTVTTFAREKRRLTTPDGSVLFVKESSTVKLEADRQLTVQKGGVYLEVNPAANRDSIDGNFLVKSPDRSVTSLGTKFAVSVTPQGTGVLVVQGKVKVDDDETLRSGQHLRPKSGEITAARRASHELDWTRDLVAAAHQPLVPVSENAGGKLVAVDPNGQEADLSLRKYHIDVHVQDGFARTTIDQTYFNHQPWRLEGTFYFPLPPDASISRLAMYVNGKLMEGGMAERDYARQVFETIKYRALDPALLEWVDGSTFKMRVFPLEGRQEKRIVLSYVQRLPRVYGRATYRFPAGHSMQRVRDWSVNIKVAGGNHLAWSSDSHNLTASPATGDLLLAAKEKNATLDRDLVLNLVDGQAAEKAADKADTARFASYEHEGWRYLMLRYRPEMKLPPRRERRDFIFLFESSADRNPLLARVQIEVLRALLEHAEYGDTFIVVTANTRAKTLFEQSQAVNPDAIAAAVEKLENTHLIGALDLEQALAAIPPLASGLENPLLIHLGSGVAVLGSRKQNELLSALPTTIPYVGVGVGRRWDRAFMRQAAANSGGYFTQINPDEPVAWRAFELLSALNTPRLQELKVSPGDKNSKIEFLNLNDSLSHGEDLLAVTRVKAGAPYPKSLTVTGLLNGEKFRRELALRDVQSGAGYLPRTWAKQQIDRLVTAGAAKHRPQIVSLSRAMYVMSPFTSLLVLENDAMYEQYKVDRGRKDHWALYNCPARISVVHKPLDAAPAEKPKTPEKKRDDKPAKPSPEEVLDSLLVRIPPPLLRLPDEPDHGGVYLVGELLNFGSQPEEYARTWSYDTWTADRENGPRTLGGPDFQSLIDLIRGTIVPEAWTDVGGPGHIEPFEGNLSLVISQTQAMHEWRGDFAGWLDVDFRAGTSASIAFSPDGRRLASGSLDGTSNTLRLWEALPTLRIGAGVHSLLESARRGPRYAYTWSDLARPSPMEERIHDQLDRETVMDFDGLPLNDALSELRKQHGIDIQLDRRALDDAGIDPRWSVTRDLRGVSLRSGLRLMLDGLDLAYLIRNDVLEITTKEVADRLRHARVYPVADLVMPTERTWSRGTSNRPWEDESFWRMNAFFDQRRRPQGSLSVELLLDDSLSMHNYDDVDGGTRLKRIRGVLSTLRSVERSHIPVADDTPITDPDFFALFAMNQRLVRHFAWRMERQAARQDVLYERPRLTGDTRPFSDLVSFAPGLNTNWADVLAVLEEEAEAPRESARGSVDAGARKLIEAARKSGWRTLTLRDRRNHVSMTLRFDGRGRFLADGVTPHGLKQSIVCDGQSLWHLYPELGLAARRKMSRFHAAMVRPLVPWLLPEAEELARGADVRRLDSKSLEIVPRNAGNKHVRLQLVFHDNGQLAQRRWIEKPSGKLLGRVEYAKDGTMRAFDAEGKKTAERRLETQPCPAPELTPSIERLVVLPMPLRTRDHVLKGIMGGKDGQLNFAAFGESDALRLISTGLYHRGREVQEIIAKRFFRKNDRRLGFYTLLLAARGNWPLDEKIEFNGGPALRMDPRRDHPDEPLAHYIAQQVRLNREGTKTSVVRRSAASSFVAERRATMINAPAPAAAGFIGELGAFRHHYIAWKTGRAYTRGEHSDIDRRWQTTLKFARECRSDSFAWILLRWLAEGASHQAEDRLQKMHRELAGAYERLQGGPLDYYARYERAMALSRAGEKIKARELAVKLYRDTFAAGGVALIDGRFGDLIGGKQRETLVRGIATSLIKQRRMPDAVALAWQWTYHGNWDFPDEIFQRILSAANDDDRLGVTLAAIEYYWQTKNQVSVHLDRADGLVQSLLEDENHAAGPAVWQLAAVMAFQRGRQAQALAHLEESLRRKYADPPGGQVNLESLREDYSQLLERYKNLAETISGLGPRPSEALLARVVGLADHWRNLEPDPTDACQAAAGIFDTLGAEELAWDYLTTPLALKPNEGGTWHALAGELTGRNQLELADRAYAAAFEAEGSNAQILWDWAKLREKQRRFKEARRLYQKIAEGDWQPAFDNLKRDAQRLLGK